MGIGDEIMAAGQAQALSRRLGEPVLIVDKHGAPRWHEVWAGNPYIAKQAGPRLTNGPGHRPYLESLNSEVAKFTRWRARDEPGSIYLTEPEKRLGQQLREALGEYVVIEPSLSPIANPNKQWGQWQALVDANPRITFVQFQGSTILDRVHVQKTGTFRAACSLLLAAKISILPEGGLHHACAALDRPAIVIFGGHTSPETTGYPGHVNLYPDMPDSPCGRWKPCPHCKEAMRRITVEQVSDCLRNADDNQD